MRRTGRWTACAAAALGVGLSGCQTWMAGMTLPSPRYLEHYPQYFPPDPQFPLPRELATQTDPEGIARGPGGGVGAPGGLVPPAAPVPAPAPGLPVPGGAVRP